MHLQNLAGLCHTVAVQAPKDEKAAKRHHHRPHGSHERRRRIACKIIGRTNAISLGGKYVFWLTATNYVGRAWSYGKLRSTEPAIFTSTPYFLHVHTTTSLPMNRFLQFVLHKEGNKFISIFVCNGKLRAIRLQLHRPDFSEVVIIDGERLHKSLLDIPFEI